MDADTCTIVMRPDITDERGLTRRTGVRHTLLAKGTHTKMFLEVIQHDAHGTQRLVSQTCG